MNNLMALKNDDGGDGDVMRGDAEICFKIVTNFLLTLAHFVITFCFTHALNSVFR
jgi:hypothetical protein